MKDNNDLVNVKVIDIDISFGQLVWLMVKASLAAIPAAMILMLFSGAVFLVIAAMK